MEKVTKKFVNTILRYYNENKRLNIKNVSRKTVVATFYILY